MEEITNVNQMQETTQAAQNNSNNRKPIIRSKDNLDKLHKIFADEAKHVFFAKCMVGLFILMVTIIILFYLAKYSVQPILSSLQLLEQYSSEKFSGNFLLSIFLISKFVILLFLLSILSWLIKIFNNLRRLEITYRDKSIMAETFSLLYVDDDYRLDEHAFSLIFEPTLQQAERKKEDKHDNDYEKLIDPLAKLIDKIADKLSSR